MTQGDAMSGSAAAVAGAIGGKVSLLHVVIVGLSLALTLGAWKYSKIQTDRRIEVRFNDERDRTIGLIRNGMQKYEDALWSGVAAVQSHDGDVTRQQWSDFASTLNLPTKYPGINGIGIIHVVPGNRFEAYLAQRRAERPDFRVFPEHDQPVRMPISFIEPESLNAAAIGLDVAHELNRRTGAEAARDTGNAKITGPIVLVQDANHTPGFLFYAPYYTQPRPTTLAARQQSFAGAVYAPFVVRKLMEGLLSTDLRDVRFSITDAGEVIYDEHTSDDPTLDPAPMFSDVLSLNLYGRTWTIDLRSNLDFRAANSYSQPTFILIGGLIIEALIIAMLVLMNNANRRAVSYADRVTSELRQEKDKLARSNAELEQFAYVTSHDLKTPIRGIGGLTEMIREDLSEYFRSPKANPEVAENLDRILERVARMNELTRAVMEFSRIAGDGKEYPPVVLREALDEMRADFALDAQQLQLSADVDHLSVDSQNLRRVLENLVGNAVKYHDGRQDLRIMISARSHGSSCVISVEDNGPGIDPRFHERIFDVFQTLRVGDAPESTGIGLSIVKKAVERHGGTVRLESSPGHGCKFEFDWPMPESDLQTAKTVEAA